MAGVRVKMRSTAVNTTLVTGDDFHLRVTASSTIDLPAAPVRGESYEVKANAGVIATLDGNGKNIEGAATFDVDGTESILVRFNPDSDEWEIC